jgi:uncharacterized repeat protein (TIGR04076 family)
VELYDLTVTVTKIEGRSVCGLHVGDSFSVSQSAQITVPPGQHLCLYALSSLLPLLPAKQRKFDPDDWLATDSDVCCPDPEERVTFTIERGLLRTYDACNLT